MIILPINKKLDISKIIHIGDIHIKQNKRKNEYEEVFGRFFDSIKDYPKEETIIVNTGDIFHTKLDLQPEGIKLCEILLRGCADLFPTVIISGNHDCLLTNKNRLDSLSPIVDAMNHPNLFYLKKSGLYSLGDICINNYGVFDDESVYINGKDIPQIYRNKYQYFICLFHGTVDGSVSEMGFKMVNKNMPISKFDNHDIVLLGDIHLQQTLQENNGVNKPTVRFCGSLCQQNHGEDLKGHGYTLWNLRKKSYKHIEIPNDYGYFTVKIDKGEIVSDLSDIPKKSRICLSCRESLPTETKAALKKIKELTEMVEPVTYKREDITEREKRSSTLAENLVRGDLKNRDHQIKLITEYITNKLEIKDEDIIKEVIRINDESNAEIKTDDIAKNIRWNILRFEWDNLFSFGENNVIDFTKVKDVVGLFATNAAGKSSVFSALSWCIFDKCERDFKANNIINDQKMSCRALIEAEIGGIHYFIERIGKMDKKGAIKVNVKFWRDIDGKEDNLTGIERSDTNTVIRSYMGTYEDFLLTSLSVQKSGKYDTSFIDLGDSGRKDLLAQFLGLNIFDKLHEVANDKLNEIIATLKVYKNENYESDLVDDYNVCSQYESALEGANTKLAVSEFKKEDLQRKIAEEQSKYIKLEDKIVDPKKSEFIIQNTKDNIEETKKKLTESTNKIDDCKKMIDYNDKKIEELEEEKVIEVYSTYQKLIVSKNTLDSVLAQKVSEAKNFKEKVVKSETYKFDPNCEFCVKNAGVVELDAINAKKELDRLKIEMDGLIIQQKPVKEKLEELKEADERFKYYNWVLKDKSNFQNLYLQHDEIVKNCNKSLNDYKERISQCEKEIETFNKNKEAVENNMKVDVRVSFVKTKLEEAIKEYNQHNNVIKDFIGKISVFKSKIETLKSKIEKVKQIEKVYRAYDLYTQSVSRDGIPYEVIISAVPHIESEVNSILSQMVDFHAKFDVDGKNIVPYIMKDERHWLMSLGSGMEQFVLSIAIRVALTNISNLPKMNGIIIDEGWATLDSEHISGVSSLLHYLKINFDFVIIISHLDSMRDLVENHMEIKKENGFSKIQYI